jgi:hypothetical protein
MAKKAPPARKAAPAAKSRSATSTPVRNTAVPKTVRKEITHELIAKRAYEIWASGTGGSEHDNWVRAERELRGS